jgi:hypothetical protein
MNSPGVLPRLRLVLKSRQKQLFSPDFTRQNYELNSIMLRAHSASRLITKYLRFHCSKDYA